MILPLIHIGGTPKAHIVNGLIEAKNALDHAIDVLSNATPHARDYACGEDHKKALFQHREWVKQVMNVSDAVNSLALTVDEL